MAIILNSNDLVIERNIGLIKWLENKSNSHSNINRKEAEPI